MKLDLFGKSGNHPETSHLMKGLPNLRPTRQSMETAWFQTGEYSLSASSLYHSFCLYSHTHSIIAFIRYPEDPSLGTWVVTQRTNLGHLKDDDTRNERVKALNKIGFEWNPRKDDDAKRWKDMLARLKAYKAKHGHCQVPQR